MMYYGVTFAVFRFCYPLIFIIGMMRPMGARNAGLFGGLVLF